MRDTFLWRLCQKECARSDCDTKYEWISNMKITKQQIKQLIKEELSAILEDRVPEVGQWNSSDEQIQQLMNSGGDYLMAKIEILEKRIEALESN